MSDALQDVLWSRNYDKAMQEKCLAEVGARFIICGHTPPTGDRARRYGMALIGEGVFAHVNNLQIIVNAQRDTFGYLDFDMNRPLPDRVAALRAPDDRPAFRMLRLRRQSAP